MHNSRVTINRCHATAAHGKPCRQTPYLDSDLCWHHTPKAEREALRKKSVRANAQSEDLAERIITADLSREQISRIESVLEATKSLAA